MPNTLSTLQAFLASVSSSSYDSYLASIAKKKRTAAQFFDDAESNDLLSLVTSNVNSDKVSKYLESETEVSYDRILIFWDE